MRNYSYRLGTHQSVAYSTVAGTIATAVGSQTYAVRVALVTLAGFVKIGDSPTATTSDVYMPAGLPEYFTITPGQKVSAISTGSGTLHVTELS